MNLCLIEDTKFDLKRGLIFILDIGYLTGTSGKCLVQDNVRYHFLLNIDISGHLTLTSGKCLNYFLWISSTAKVKWIWIYNEKHCKK